ncbi:MAG TPA: hypothetical protein PK013_05410, partial [Thermosynergistes sp.]|nr:hypothetical protein [Thermosynergistes sp.]
MSLASARRCRASKRAFVRGILAGSLKGWLKSAIIAYCDTHTMDGGRIDDNSRRSDDRARNGKSLGEG